jgi:hypothetical protein
MKGCRPPGEKRVAQNQNPVSTVGKALGRYFAAASLVLGGAPADRFAGQLIDSDTGEDRRKLALQLLDYFLHSPSRELEWFGGNHCQGRALLYSQPFASSNLAI